MSLDELAQREKIRALTNIARAAKKAGHSTFTEIHQFLVDTGRILDGYTSARQAACIVQLIKGDPGYSYLVI